MKRTIQRSLTLVFAAALFAGFIIVSYVLERGCYDPTTIAFEYDPEPCH